MISNMSKIVPSNAANEASIALLDTLESVTPSSVLSETKQTQRLCVACAERSAPEDNYLFCDICLEEIKSGSIPANLRAKPPDTTFDLYPDCCLRRKLAFGLFPLIEYLHEYFAEERKVAGPERLKCSICKRMLVRPTECFPCRHTFCDPCLKQLAHFQHCQEGFPENYCPVCRQVIHYTQRNVTLEREVEDSEISTADRRLSEMAVANPWPLPGYAILRRLCHKYYQCRPMLKPVHFICDYPRLTTNTFTGKSHVTAAMQGIAFLVYFLAIPSLLLSSMCRSGSNDGVYTLSNETTVNISVLNETGHTVPGQADPASCHSSEQIVKPLLRLLLTIPIPAIIAAAGFVMRMSCIICTPREWRVFQAIVFALFVCYGALVPGFNALRTTTPERCPFDGVRCLVGSVCWGSFAFIGTLLTIWRHRYYLRACFREMLSRHGAAASLDRVY